MKYTCEKCGKTMDENQFYTYKDGRKTELCKKCLTMHIDNFDESTYVWLLEKMDVPYIPSEWNTLRDRAYAANPNLNGMSVFGKYLSKMKLRQFKDKGWADTKALQQESEQKAEAKKEEIKEREAEITERFKNGEITESEYKTLTSTLSQKEAGLGGDQNPYIGPDNPYDETKFISEDELPDPAATLTQDDKVYLAMKWGRLYQPAEWVELERTYTEMQNSFDIQDADTTNTLILICKTNLKMNQALDAGDIEGYQKLSKVSESLRKSAKFTAAQNKEAKSDFVDSVGELVALCERDGFIPRYVTDVPQDKVDLTLKDMNEYLHKLVTQDLGFGQQIEDALKKIQIQNEMNAAADQKTELADNDFEELYQEIERQKDTDDDLFDPNGSAEEVES